MKINPFVLAIVGMLGTNYAVANFAQFTASGSGGGGGAYTGFLDTYAGATWAWSTYQPSSSYVGNFAVVHRQSDSATTTIAYAGHKASISAFNTFCAGTNCFADTLYDGSGNAHNATLTNVRMIVDANNNLAVCPGPSGTGTVPYNAVFSTAQQELFTVAKASFLDNNFSQTDLPAITLTGNITSGSAGITSMSSQTGINVTTDSPQGTGYTGITDSAGYIPVGTALTALPTGSTGTMSFNPGNASPTGSQTGDTLTVTNAVRGGAWLVAGPASSSFDTSAYWGFGLGAISYSGYAGDANIPKNGSGANISSSAGEGMRGAWAVWDLDAYNNKLYYNGTQVAAGNVAANITYSTNVGLTLFSNTNGTEVAQNSCFEAMYLYSSPQTSRAAMATNLNTQHGFTALPTAFTTSDGFTMTPEYMPNNAQFSSIYGSGTYGPDINSITWAFTQGGYAWPSAAVANNTNNSTTMWRFIVHQGDSDVNITQAERAEVAAYTGGQVAPGQSFSAFYQFTFDQYSTQSGDWCYTGQIHYNDVSSSAPDIVAIDCKSNHLQFVYQKGAGPTTTSCGSSLALTQGTVYAVEIEGFWSTNHTTDTLTIKAGTNGASLGTVCSVSGALWDNDTGAYAKMGVYRGYPWSNSGALIERVMNYKWSNTANTYASLATTQPALPTHP